MDLHVRDQDHQSFEDLLAQVSHYFGAGKTFMICTPKVGHNKKVHEKE